jgi:signal transduction histidine kinase
MRCWRRSTCHKKGERGIVKNFFTSNWEFTQEERDLRSKFQMMNIGIVLSSVAVLYGTLLNSMHDRYYLASFEFFLFLSNVVLWYLLRKDKKYFDFVSLFVTAQFTLLLIVLIYVSKPEDMKTTWFFTYPIIILYFKDERKSVPWFLFLIMMILIAPLQPFIEIDFTFFQLFYLALVLSIVTIIVYFYKIKMDEAARLIQKQEKMINLQSRQAVMGEMISMIAHQWRQPLSTVTLQISNLEVKKLLGEKPTAAEYEEALEKISDTVVYLSDTIDDFQTYFRPNKEVTTLHADELVQKAIAFVEPRLKKYNISLHFKESEPTLLHTYANEIVQVLLNILNNAIDEFIEREIKNPQIFVEIIKRLESIVIMVRDNAGGIATENIATIFEPYFSTKGKNGTGLGLYMSQMIMQKQFNTKIEVLSSQEGSVFRVEVPLRLA